MVTFGGTPFPENFSLLESEKQEASSTLSGFYAHNTEGKDSVEPFKILPALDGTTPNMMSGNSLLLGEDEDDYEETLLYCEIILIGVSDETNSFEIWKGSLTQEFSDAEENPQEDRPIYVQWSNIDKISTENDTTVPLPRIRRFFNSFTDENHIYIYGGLAPPYTNVTSDVTEDFSDVLGDLWSFDLETKEWAQIDVPEELQSRFLAEGVGFEVKNTENTWLGRAVYVYYIVIHGGYTYEGDIARHLSDTWMLDVDSGKWSKRNLNFEQLNEDIKQSFIETTGQDCEVRWHSMVPSERKYVLIFGSTISDTASQITHVAYFSLLDYSPKCDKKDSFCGSEELDRLEMDGYTELPAHRIGQQVMLLDHDLVVIYGGIAPFFNVSDDFLPAYGCETTGSAGCYVSSPSISLAEFSNETYPILNYVLSTYEHSRGNRVLLSTMSDGWAFKLKVVQSSPVIDVAIFLPTLAVTSGFMFLAFFSGMFFFSGRWLHTFFFSTNVDNSFPRFQGENGAPFSLIDRLHTRPISPSIEGEPCPICLTYFKETISKLHEPIKELPCHHLFHVDCIDPWLFSNKACPICKHEIDIPTRQMSMESLMQGNVRPGTRLVTNSEPQIKFNEFRLRTT